MTEAEKGSRVYLGIGSNMGNREQNLSRAIKALGNEGIVSVTKTSSIYETSPVGVVDQPVFLNAVIKVRTLLTPYELLDFVKAIEIELGRKKTQRWGPRVIDIDILLFDDMVIQSETLTIPHSEMKKRAFVLIPLKEIDPSHVFPDGTNIDDYLENLSGEDIVIPRKDIFLTDQI